MLNNAKMTVIQLYEVISDQQTTTMCVVKIDFTVITSSYSIFMANITDSQQVFLINMLFEVSMITFVAPTLISSNWTKNG